MRIFLIVWAALVMAGMVYFNHYQNEMMMEGVEQNRPDPRLEEIAAELSSINTVYVLITSESQEAFTRAVVDNPGKKVWELEVNIEDRVHDLEVSSGEGTVPALLVFTRESLVWNDVALRTDMPLYVLDYIRNDPNIDHIVLNPPPGITESVPDAIVLDSSEVSTLYWRLK